MHDCFWHESEFIQRSGSVIKPTPNRYNAIFYCCKWRTAPTLTLALSAFVCKKYYSLKSSAFHTVKSKNKYVATIKWTACHRERRIQKKNFPIRLIFAHFCDCEQFDASSSPASNPLNRFDVAMHWIKIDAVASNQIAIYVDTILSFDFYCLLHVDGNTAMWSEQSTKWNGVYEQREHQQQQKRHKNRRAAIKMHGTRLVAF